MIKPIKGRKRIGRPLFQWEYEQGKFDSNLNDSVIFEVFGV